LIAARWDWNPTLGWHQVPCLGPGPFERIAIRMRAAAQLQRIKAMLSLVELQDVARAA
jgi:hypothetical protein